jgi:putative ABC transport system permease protein
MQPYGSYRVHGSPPAPQHSLTLRFLNEIGYVHNPMEGFLKDLKHSLRMLRQSKAFAATAITALALGIGANTAIFSIVNTVLLKPVPFPDPDRLVMFMNTSAGAVQGSNASPAKFQHWKSQSTIQDAAAFRNGVVNLTSGEAPEQLQSAQVSADYFKLFGAPIVRGRTFTAQEDSPGGENVVVLSSSLWLRRFAGDAAILGKTMALGGDPYVVIGIVGPTFDVREFGPSPEVWTPFQFDPNTTDQGHYFQAAGRLKPGVTLEQANAQLAASVSAFREKYPRAFEPQGGFAVLPFREAFVRNVRQILLVLLGAVSFVLLIACTNVANLLLARATARKREMAIRVAMGARRGRLIRQLLSENILLFLAGGLLGLALGVVGIHALLSVNTAGIPRVGENGAVVTMDWRVVAFTLLISLGTGVLFGLIPALQGTRTDLNAHLKESGGRSGTGLRQAKLRSLLVVIEVALALTLLVGSALLIRTQLALTNVPAGFDTTNVLTMRMSLTGPRFFKSSDVDLMVGQATDRLRALPGVLNASATCCLPSQGGYGLPFAVAGRPLPPNGVPFHGGGGWLTVSPGYFDVFRIPVKRGRAFTDRDDATAPPVVIINEAMAKRFWVTGDDPLKARLAIGRGVMRELATEPDRQIVGIVGNVRDAGLNNDPQPKMYIPQSQLSDGLNALNLRLTPIAWVIRTQVEPSSLVPNIREELRQATGLPVSEVRQMTEIVSRATSRQRFNMLLMTTFACAALLLAAIGVYGLIAYSVEQRTQEIGIRLALGAKATRLQNAIVLHGMSLTVIGVVLGISLSFTLMQFVTRLLFEVKPWDPTVYVTISVLLTVVALFAVWIPARRASRINPIEALRYE